MNLPSELKYAESHEWVRIEGDIAIVGVTEHAQEQLGELVFVELPEVGRTVSAEEATAVVESVKAASDVYAPLSGEVVEVNEALSDKPETVNEACYSDGWLFKLKASDPSELEKLMDAAAYASANGI